MIAPDLASIKLHRNKLITTLLLSISLLVYETAFSQAPHGINYQAVARNSQGIVISSQPVTVRFSILEGSPSGLIIYNEIHQTTTNSFGLFSLAIGRGTPQTGSFGNINWGNGNLKFLKTEIAINSGPFDLQNISQLLSVPFALFAEKTKLTAGNAIKVNNDTISANYVAGAGIRISKDTIIAEAGAEHLKFDTVHNVVSMMNYTGKAAALFVTDSLRGGWFVKTTAAKVDSGIVFPGVGAFWRRNFAGYVRPEWWGAKGDGATDDSRAIQQSFDAFPDRITVDFDNKTYIIGRPISRRNVSNIQLRGNNAILKSTVNKRDTTIVLGGSYLDSVSIMADIQANSNGFEVGGGDAGKLGKGDYIKLSSSEPYFNADTRNYMLGELLRVDTVIGTKVVIEGFIDLAYSRAGQNLKAYKINMTENLLITNLSLVGIGSDAEQIGLYIYNTRGLVLNNLSLGKFLVACQLNECVNGLITNNYVFENNNQDIGYGVVLSNGSRDFTISNNTSYNNRHFFTTGDNYGVVMNVLVTGNVASNEIKAPFHTHGNAKYVHFSNNLVKNSMGGIATLSPNTTIESNTVINSIGLNAPIQTTECGAVNLVVRNNIIRSNPSFVNAIEVIQTGKGLRFENNFIHIESNRIEDFPNGAGILVANNPHLLTIRNNAIHKYGYQAILVDSVDNIIVSGNVIEEGRRNTYAISLSAPGLISRPNPYGKTGIVVNNQILREGNYGISVSGFDRLTLKDNIINVTSNKITVNNVGTIDSFGVYQALSTENTPTFRGLKLGELAIGATNAPYRLTIDSLRGNYFASAYLAADMGAGKWIGQLFGYTAADPGYKKGGIIFESSDATGRGRFHLALNDKPNSDNVGLQDSKLAIDYTGNLSISGTTLRIKVPKTPNSSTDTGNAGDWCWDANFIYVCIATNKWVRAPLSSW